MQVAPIAPPVDVPPGELVTFEGYEANILEPGNKSSKIWSKICDDFKVNDKNEATFKGIPFMTSKGPVTSPLIGGIS